MKKALRYLVIFLVPLACGLHAQNAAPGATPDITVEFRLYAWGTKLPPLNYGKDLVVETLEDGEMSSIQTYSGPPELSFTRVAKKPNPRKPAPIVASIHIPANAGQVVLLTAPAGHGLYTMYLIPYSTVALPPGHALLHNLSSKRLLIVLNGTQQIQMASGETTQVAGTGKALVVQVAAQENNRWAALFNNVIQLDKHASPNVLFIGGQSGSGVGMFILPPWPDSHASKPAASN